MVERTRTLRPELQAGWPFLERVAYRSTAAQDPATRTRPLGTAGGPAPADPGGPSRPSSGVERRFLNAVTQHLPSPLRRETSLDHTLYCHRLPLADPDDWLLRRTSPGQVNDAAHP